MARASMAAEAAEAAPLEPMDDPLAPDGAAEEDETVEEEFC